MKKILSFLLVLILILTPFSYAFADDGGSYGTSGETKPSVSKGGGNVHEFPTDSAIHGYRVYLAPKSHVIENGIQTEAKPGSEFEKWAVYATYVLNKTALSNGDTIRIVNSSKFSFSDSDQQISDFVTLKYNKSNTWVSMKDMNVYDGKEKANSLISLINNSEASAPKVQGRTSNDYPESCLGIYVYKDGAPREFFTIAPSSVLTRNWAVYKEDSQDFFQEALGTNGSGSSLESLLQSRGTTITEAIMSFREYTIKQYAGTALKDKVKSLNDTDELAVIIEPVFGYINENAPAPAIMTASQYARWATGISSNYSDGHGIMHWYEKKSSVNNSKASYVYSRTTNSTETKLWSMTAYNYASTLRPYADVKSRKKLSEHGGWGYIIPGTENKLTMSIFCDYIYKLNADGTVSILSEADSAYNHNDASLAGSTEDFAIGAKKFDTKEGEAAKLDGTSLIKKENNGIVERYYTFILQFKGSGYEGLEDYSDISAFVDKFGKGALEVDNKTTKSNIEKEIKNSIKKTLESSTVLKKTETDSNNVLNYIGLPDDSRNNYLEVLGSEIGKGLKKDFGFKVILSRQSEWEENGVGTAWIHMLKDNNSIQSLALDGEKVDKVNKLSTKYSGDIMFTEYDGNVSAVGTIPITIAIVSELPKVTSSYSYHTYMVEDKKAEIKERGTYSVTHDDVISVSPLYEGISNENKQIGKYFAFTFDKVSKSDEDISIENISEFVKSTLDKNDLGTNNRTTVINKICSEIEDKFNVSGVSGEYLGNGYSHNGVLLAIRSNSSTTKTFGTNAIIIEYINLDDINNEEPNESNESNSGADMKEYELNTLENFYTVPYSVIDNRGSVSEPGKRLTKETTSERIVFSQRYGAPHTNSAPILGGYDIQTLLNSSGVSALKPAFTWTSKRNISHSVTNGTRTTETMHELYTISRAKLGDIRAVADFSLWNTTDYKANEVVSGKKMKEVLDILGLDYGFKPIKDKSDSKGSKSIISKSGKYGTQSIVTANGTGWVVKDVYNTYKRDWINSGYYTRDLISTTKDPETGQTTYEYGNSYYVDTSHWGSWYSTGNTSDTQNITSGKFNMISAKGEDGDVSSASILDSRNYNIEYTMATYVPYTESDKKGSKNKFTIVNNISEVNNDLLGKNNIVDRKSLLVNVEFTDRAKEVLGIYPEVLMTYKVPNDLSFASSNVSNWSLLGDEYNGYNNGFGGTHTGDAVSSFSSTSKYVFTVGEKARYFNPTSFMKIEVYGKNNKASNLSEEDVSGELNSNSFATSAKVKSLLNTMGVRDAKTPVILSGGGYTVSTNKNINLELTSYSIDIASAGDGVISAENLSTEINMKDKWKTLASGNYSAESVHKKFVENALSGLSHELNIIVKGDKNEINESLKLKASDTKETETTLDATYNIYIRGGNVTNKNDIISAIAHDLMSEDTNSYTTAESLEEATKIYNSLNIEKMIVAQLETKSSTLNKSDTLANNKWYDESCSTLVVRKYSSKISVGNVSASDKLDITWGAKQSKDRNTLYSTGNKAGIEYKLKLNSIKLPSGTELSLSKSLLESMVKDTNFIIPDASISDARY